MCRPPSPPPSRRRWRPTPSSASPPRPSSARRCRSAPADRGLPPATSQSEAPDATLAVAPDEPSEPRFLALRPERWIPQIAMQLHLPPPKMPPLRLLGPLVALLVSLGGLIY